MANTADAVIAFALAQVGKPYKFGATGPNAYDCSGLVDAAAKSAGVPFPFRETTFTLMVLGTEVARKDLLPGDLIFPDAGHVQIYLGNNQIVEAAHTGTNIRVMPLGGFIHARRIWAPGTGSATTTSTIPAIDIPNPLDPLQSAIDSIKQLMAVFSKLSDMGKWLSDTHNWARIGWGMLGVVFLLFGLAKLGAVVNATQKVVKAVPNAN